MPIVVTISEQRLREAERRRVAARTIMSDLKEYARARGGRFLVFGLRYDSDFDVVVDFPADMEASAIDHVEFPSLTYPK